jgi:hypothetical protein
MVVILLEVVISSYSSVECRIVSGSGASARSVSSGL